MRRLWSVLATLVFLALAPAVVAVLAPWLITGWRTQPPFPGGDVTLALGAALLGAGLFVLLDGFARFALQGLGSPAPIYPTRRLVVGGLHGLVRNPIYLAVVSIVLGEALLIASPALVLYALVLAAAFHLLVVFYEEPALRLRFAADYEQYCKRTPRWLPRLRGARAQPPR